MEIFMRAAFFSMEEVDIRYWLAVRRLKIPRGYRPRLVDAIINEGPEALFGTFAESAPDLALEPRLAQSIKGFDDWAWVDGELALMDEAGAGLLTLNDPLYPARLKEIPDPPFFLYYRGDLSLLAITESVAIVGTRRPTHYGLRVAQSLGSDLASLGILIVSGMAKGCDSAAHKGALEAGGATVAVLGTGVDRCYPGEARQIYEQLGVKGLLLSEFPMGAGPKAYNFPRRNRIISGLSRGLIVVEAPLRSGAMMTSRLALEQNRDVFAVPGPLTSYKSKGPNSLIKSGAVLVEAAGDVLAEWGLSPGTMKTCGVGRNEGKDSPAEGNEALVFKGLEEGPLSIDELASLLGINTAELGGVLLEMELKGLVSQGPGKIFTRIF